MLTNTERQQIVEEVNAGTYGIDEAQDDIAAAQKGEEVRKALYAEALVLNREGHAGSNDMIARQQIANLQTSVNGQISTLRTEVGDDIDDLETALNSGLATQNGKIAAQDATIANVVANYNVEYGSTELWASTGETGALAAGTTVTLSEDVSHFDYIDIYSFCGNSNVLDTVPVDANLQTGTGYALRWVNLSDPGSGTYEAYVRIVETKIHINGTTLTINHQVTYRNGANTSIGGVEITSSNKSTYMGEFGIMKVVGRKITANTEVEDIRTGADGTAYNSAGAAVRAQVQALEDDADGLHDDIGNIEGLETTEKTNLVLAINELEERLGNVEGQSPGSGLTDTQKALLITILKNAIYSSNQRGNILDLENSFAKTVVSIAVDLNLNGNTIYSDDSLDTLRQYLTVRATYDDGGTQVVYGYALSGTLTVGTSTIQISYREYTASVNVSVSQAVVRYTVTNTLTGVTNSNTDTSIAAGNTYTGVLSANTAGYVPVDVSVTVDGTDVTSTAYSTSTRTITISNVQGNIVITASEAEDPYAPAYELSSALVMGDTTDPRINDTTNNRIATGVTIKDNETWTICIDFTSKSGSTNKNMNGTIVTNGTQTKLEYNGPFWVLQWHNDTSGNIADNNNSKFTGINMVFVLTHEADATEAYCYGTREKTIANTHSRTNDGQIYIGSAKEVGTLNRFAIYKRVLSSAEITAWIGA